jgi:hypothetical protein
MSGYSKRDPEITVLGCSMVIPIPSQGWNKCSRLMIFTVSEQNWGLQKSSVDKGHP